MCNNLSTGKHEYSWLLLNNVTIILFRPMISCEQVSLRDPLRSGADDEALREIIGAAVSI